MAGVKTLADGRIALVALTTKPVNLSAPTLAEITAGKHLECQIMKSDYKLGSTGSSTVPEQEMCKKGEGNAPGPASFEGVLTVFRYLDPATGKPAAGGEDDYAWKMLKTAGTPLWLVEREGPEADVAFASGDEVAVYEVLTGHRTKPDDRFSGYIKRTVAMFVQDADEDATVAAGA